MQPGDTTKRPPRVPSSGRGASSALDAMIRKRIPAPGRPGPSPSEAKSSSPQARSTKRRS
jgi:hypothetical protein